MTPDFYSWEPGFSHQKGDRFSYLTDVPKGLVMRTLPSYTTNSKSQSFRIAAQERKNVLAPLADGRPVTLEMKLPRPMAAKKKSVEGKPTLVVITPGPLFGADRDVFLVSVIGKGAALIAPIRSKSTADLVMSGFPARIASMLLRELRLLLWSPSCHL